MSVNVHCFASKVRKRPHEGNPFRYVSELRRAGDTDQQAVHAAMDERSHQFETGDQLDASYSPLPGMPEVPHPIFAGIQSVSQWVLFGAAGQDVLIGMDFVLFLLCSEFRQLVDIERAKTVRHLQRS
jgi:hypothetical protein